MIKIKSRKEGFRRCGIAHSKAETQYPDDKFSGEELQTLMDEPMLMVEVVDDGTGVPEGLSAKEAIRLAGEAADTESLDVLAQGEERKSVLDAIAARRKSLQD